MMMACLLQPLWHEAFAAALLLLLHVLTACLFDRLQRCLAPMLLVLHVVSTSEAVPRLIVRSSCIMLRDRNPCFAALLLLVWTCVLARAVLWSLDLLNSVF